MKRRVQITFFLVFFLSRGECLIAQPYYFKHYQVENGLANSTVFCSVQDRQGFLWFGTKEGLNRFDGYHFKLFSLYDDNNETQKLTADHIYCLSVDNNGVLWAGTQQGLFRYDAQKERLVRSAAPMIEVGAIHMDNRGMLWFLSYNAVYRYDLRNHIIKYFPVSGYFNATSICETKDGSMWFSSGDGFIHRYDQSSGTFTRYDLFAHSTHAITHWIQTIYAAADGTLFVGTTDQGLKQFDPATAAYTDILTRNPDKTTIYVRDIVQYSRNEYWIATESGIFIYNSDAHTFVNLRKKFRDPYSLSDNAIYTLCKDSEGGIWAGTFFGGVCYYQKEYSYFEKYFPDNTANSISGSSVREICEDHYGNIWIGTEDAGLNKLDKNTGAITHFEPGGDKTSIAYSNIHGLLVDGDDLWIGTFEHGLDILDIRTGKVRKHYMAGPRKQDLKSNFIVSLLRTRSGEIYAGSGDGLYHYNRISDDFEFTAGIPAHIFVSCLTEDHTGTIWIGTTSLGLYCLNPQTGRTGTFQNDPGSTNSLSNNSVNAVFEDSRYQLCLSTEGGGICKLDSSRSLFTRYTTKDGLPSNFVFKALEDNNKDLWITTSRGLMNMAGKRSSIYTKANGLLNDQFNYNSGYRDENGKMYFGSVKGMITFQPSELPHNNFVPPVYITGLQVNNREPVVGHDQPVLKQSVIYTHDITLPYDQSSLSIDFTALSYASPEMTEYNYLMEGLDKEWTYLKSNRKVYFTNLSPGKYVFRLKAATGGVWNNQEKQLVIHILPPFWATAWAWLVYATLIILLAGYLISNYHKRIENRKEKEIYEAKLDFFTNIAHEIRTPLTLIKGPLENLMDMVPEMPAIKPDVTTMERNTNRLIALVTQILDFRQTETKGFSLTLSKINITALLQEVYTSFAQLAAKSSLDYQLDLPDQELIAWADEEAMQKIISNLISNAVKYARHTVMIRLHPMEKEAFMYTIEMTNDGHIIPADMKERIFEPFYRLKETLRQKGTGIGLTLARSLVELHEGKLNLKDGDAGLNTFVLCMPFKPEQQIKRRPKKYAFLTTQK